MYIVQGRPIRPTWFVQLDTSEQIRAQNVVFQLVGKNLSKVITQADIEANGINYGVPSLPELNELRDYLLNVTNALSNKINFFFHNY